MLASPSFKEQPLLASDSSFTKHPSTHKPQEDEFLHLKFPTDLETESDREEEFEEDLAAALMHLSTAADDFLEDEEQENISPSVASAIDPKLGSAAVSQLNEGDLALQDISNRYDLAPFQEGRFDLPHAALDMREDFQSLLAQPRQDFQSPVILRTRPHLVDAQEEEDDEEGEIGSSTEEAFHSHVQAFIDHGTKVHGRRHVQSPMILLRR